MAVYTKSASVSGKWVKGGDIKSGTKAKLKAETVKRESQFKNKDETVKMQDVSKIRFEDDVEVYNIALNRATIDALIDAFGPESNNWIDKVLTTQVEKMVVAGRAVRALYLIPEGFELGEDQNGYMVINRIGSKDEDVNQDLEDELDASSIPF
jgi:hypothetical protein